MRATSSIGLALLPALALAAGCAGGEQTSFMVTVAFDDTAHQPTGLLVTVLGPQRTLKGDVQVTAPDGRAIRTDDRFAVWLPEDLDGVQATVKVQATGDPGTPPLCPGEKAETVRRGKVIPVTISLDCEAPLDAAVDAPLDAGRPDLSSDLAVDAGADLAPEAGRPDLQELPDLGADFAVPPDLSVAEPLDGPPPDLVPVPDLTVPPDLTVLPDLACVPGCAAGVETSCPGGVATTTPCTFGCNGATCFKPDSCGSPAADVSSGGSFSGTLTAAAGYTDDATGSCWNNSAGPDLVTRLTVPNNEWHSVAIDTGGSNFDTVLYTRLSCNVAGTELPIEGPAGCTFGGLSPLQTTGTMCNNDDPYGWGTLQSRLFLCNLPPAVTYYTWLDSRGAGGKYVLNVYIGPTSTLSNCNDAGNLLDGNQTFTNLTTVGHQPAAGALASTLACGDKGANSPEAVFFLAVPAAQVGKSLTVTTKNATFKHVVYVRPVGQCQTSNPGDLACAASGNPPSATALVASLKLSTAGLYYVIVDGNSSPGVPATGTFDMQLTFK